MAIRMQGVNSDGEEISSMYVAKAEDFSFYTEDLRSRDKSSRKNAM